MIYLISLFWSLVDVDISFFLLGYIHKLWLSQPLQGLQLWNTMNTRQGKKPRNMNGILSFLWTKARYIIVLSTHTHTKPPMYFNYSHPCFVTRNNQKHVLYSLWKQMRMVWLCHDVAWLNVERGEKKAGSVWRKRGEMWGRLSSWLSMWLDACSSSCLSSPRPSRTGLSSCRCWKIFFPVIGCRTSSLSYVDY